MLIREAIEVAREIARDYQSTADNSRAYDCPVGAAILERRVDALKVLIEFVEAELLEYY